MSIRFKVKPLIDGDCRGRVIVLNQYLSFFGEVDSSRGIVKTDNGEVEISGKVLVFKGSRGSTVGSYVIYALKKNGVAPACMVVREVEPILIAGCVLTEIPLLVAEGFDDLVGLFLKGGVIIHNKGENYAVFEEG
ncbi:MAG: DUF126 domain-containing protein [Thermosphaera sp.]